MSARQTSTENLVIEVVLILLVAALVLAWLVVEVGKLLVTTAATYPHSRALWTAMGVALAATLAAIVGSQSALALPLVGLAACSWIGAVLTAKAVQVFYDQCFQRPVTVDRMVSDALTFPWW